MCRALLYNKAKGSHIFPINEYSILHLLFIHVHLILFLDIQEINALRNDIMILMYWGMYNRRDTEWSLYYIVLGTGGHCSTFLKTK